MSMLNHVNAFMKWLQINNESSTEFSRKKKKNFKKIKIEKLKDQHIRSARIYVGNLCIDGKSVIVNDTM